MKIVHAVHHLPPESIGGTQNYVLSVATVQADAGHDVWILTRGVGIESSCECTPFESGGTLTIERITDPEPHFDDFRKLHNIEILVAFERLVCKARPDVVHVHHWIALSIKLAATCRRLDVPVVVTLHDLFVSCPTGHRIHVDGRFCHLPVNLQNCQTCVREGGNGSQQLTKSTKAISGFLSQRQQSIAAELDSASKIFSANRTFLDFVSRYVSIDPRRMEILPLPVTPLPKQTVRAPDERFVIGHFGSLNPQKGPHLIIKAVSRLDTHVQRSISIVLLGKVSTEEYRQALAGYKGDFELVVTDRTYDPASLSSYSFDVCVFPSRHFESFSLAVKEAIGLGVPVIVSDTGVPASYIDGCGLTFKRDDTNDLAERILELFESEPLRRSCRKACSTNREHEMNLMEHVERLFHAYRCVAPTGH